MPLLLTLLIVLSVFTAQPARADRDELEAWQSRVIEALERAGQAASEESDDDQRTRIAPDGSADPGARAAAAEAQRLYGGRVLAVGPAGNGYRVRLLLDDGRVKTVVIRD